MSDPRITINGTHYILENYHLEEVKRLRTEVTKATDEARINKLKELRQTFSCYDWGIHDPLSIIDGEIAALTSQQEEKS